jgi:UDP-glucose 4-epimerase
MNGKVLITGVCGFLGTNLQNELAKQGYKVVGIDNLSGGNKDNLLPSTTFYSADCRSKLMMDDVFEIEKPELLFHLAADATESRSQFTPISATENNFQSSVNVFTSAIKHGVKRIIFTSSIATYGDQEPPFREDYLLKPIDIYAVNKRASEEALKILCDVHNTEYVIFRPYNIVGKYQNLADPYRNVAAIFMNRIMNGQPPLIYGDGEQVRSFSPVENIIPVFIKAMTAKVSGETFNIGPDKAITVNQLAETILEIMSSNLKPQHVEERPHEVRSAYCDTTKVREALGYQSIVSLKECLMGMALWAKTIGYQEPKYLDNLEIVSESTPKVWLEKRI